MVLANTWHCSFIWCEVIMMISYNGHLLKMSGCPSWINPKVNPGGWTSIASMSKTRGTAQLLWSGLPKICPHWADLSATLHQEWYPAGKIWDDWLVQHSRDLLKVFKTYQCLWKDHKRTLAVMCDFRIIFRQHTCNEHSIQFSLFHFYHLTFMIILLLNFHAYTCMSVLSTSWSIFH